MVLHVAMLVILCMIATLPIVATVRYVATLSVVVQILITLVSFFRLTWGNSLPIFGSDGDSPNQTTAGNHPKTNDPGETIGSLLIAGTLLGLG